LTYHDDARGYTLDVASTIDRYLNSLQSLS
jgi:hypothetical protein